MEITSTMVVMLIWGGMTATGGPAVIQGFDSLPVCELARPAVEAVYEPQNIVQTKCAGLPKAVRSDTERAEYERLRRKFEGQ